MKNEQMEEERIHEIVDVIQKIASGDFSARILISEKGDSLDAIASGINMLGDEIEAYTKDKEDQSEALLNMLEDVNEAKEISQRAEEALRESEEKLRKILESSPDAITVTDLKGNIIECNHTSLDLYGFLTKEELIGKNGFDLVAPKDMQREKVNMEITPGLYDRGKAEYTLLTKNGGEFLAEVSSSVIRDSSGNPTSFVAIT